MNEYTILVRRFDIGEKVLINQKKWSLPKVEKYNGSSGIIHSYDCPMNMYFVKLMNGEKISVSPFEIKPYIENTACEEVGK